jgi:hypothetical protein
MKNMNAWSQLKRALWRSGFNTDPKEECSNSVKLFLIATFKLQNCKEIKYISLFIDVFHSFPCPYWSLPIIRLLKMCFYLSCGK